MAYLTTFKMKTPLRYPGGKSRAMKFLGEYFPQDIQSYVEPFLDGTIEMYRLAGTAMLP